MKKNTAGQTIGAQLISKTDGSPITTGTATIYITGDGGTQAIGSVGSGLCTHKGNGYWSYSPSQAETNFDIIAFTVNHTDACTATIQVETSYPQTGDSFSRIGANGAGLTAIGDTRLGNLDAAVSSRSTFAGGAVASVTGSVGSVVGLTAANLDATVSSRLATASYTAPDNATISAILGYVDELESRLTLVRANLLDNIANLDTTVSSRLPTTSYTAPNNAGIASVITYVDELETRLSSVRANLLDNLSNLDALISSRFAAASYVAPDNAGIGANGIAIAALPSATDVTDSVLSDLRTLTVDKFMGLK